MIDDAPESESQPSASAGSATKPTIGFVTYEIHPTTWGGCGVLLHHAAKRLLASGHRVVFLLAVSPDEYRQFVDVDRHALPNPEQCVAYRVGDLCASLPTQAELGVHHNLYETLKFAAATRALLQREQIDLLEFFEYCGSGYYALLDQLVADLPTSTILATRLHNSIELIDEHGATNRFNRDHYDLYALERGLIRWSETLLTPSTDYFEAYYREAYALAPTRVSVSQSPKTTFPQVTRRPSTDAPFALTYFGRLHQFKNVHQFVEAGVRLMRLRPDLPLRLKLIGSDSPESPFGGSYAEYLRRLIPADLSDRVEFLGHLDHAAAIEHLNQTLCAVFPNHFESFCYAIHEAYDAGVPVICRDLPGLRPFFKHEQTALIYDGSTAGLVDACLRMIDDADLRTGLTRPRPVATEPLGTIYTSPERRSPLIDPRGAADGSHQGAAPLETLALILGDGDPDAEATTRRALEASAAPASSIILLDPAGAEDGRAQWLLGSYWIARDAAGQVRTLAEVTTREACVLLDAGDQPDRDWLTLTSRALQRRADLGYAGTWLRDADESAGSFDMGSTRPLLVDLTPETWPFERGPSRCHVLVRTTPNTALLDLFDPQLGSYGEIGLIWQRCAAQQFGVCLPQARFATAPQNAPTHDLNLLSYLVLRYGDQFGARLARYAALQQARVLAPPTANAPSEHVVMPTPSVDDKRRYAAQLGGRDLLSIVARKATARFRGGTYSG